MPDASKVYRHVPGVECFAEPRPRMLDPILALLACLVFVLAGQIFIPLLGIEDDESLFAAPLLRPKAWVFALKIGHGRVPLMIMTYIGTLKTAIYAVVF